MDEERTGTVDGVEHADTAARQTYWRAPHRSTTASFGGGSVIRAREAVPAAAA